MVDETIPRRRFLVGAGLAGTAIATGFTPVLPVPAAAQTPAAPPTAAPAAAVAAADSQPLLTLTETEHAFVVAAIDALIPADELSPAGSDCGIATFIDRQLASAWGGGAKMYRGGPFRKGKPEQGYQLPLTPREFFATGIASANDWSHTTYGKSFDRLSAADRVSALQAMETGKAKFQRFSSRAFFNQLLTITMQGFFSDPVYGGNHGMVSWKMLGYPGLPATYADVIDEYRAKRYVAPPQSIADFS